MRGRLSAAYRIDKAKSALFESNPPATRLSAEVAGNRVDASRVTGLGCDGGRLGLDGLGREEARDLTTRA